MSTVWINFRDKKASGVWETDGEKEEEEAEGYSKTAKKDDETGEVKKLLALPPSSWEETLSQHQDFGDLTLNAAGPSPREKTTKYSGGFPFED